VFGRFLRSDLTPEGNEFLVNTTTIGPQIHPAIAADGVGRFLVAWSSFAGLAPGFDLFAQRYASTLQPLTAPNPPFVTVLSSSALTVSWPPVAGLNVADYEVYADGAATPTAVVVTNTWWTMTYGVNYYYYVIPSEWMAYYFGPYYWTWPSPYADSDGSGASNLYDFLAGTCPTNAASVLRMQLQSTVQGLFLNWNTQPGLIYQVQVSTNLNGWTNLGGMRFAPGTVDSMYVGGSPSSYYRVLRVR
jgi:hypothetical protein